MDALVDMESVRCFAAAADRLNFRAAAEAVHLSPAALSDRIRRLEEDLGVQLFERTTRRVRLTDAGLRLRKSADSLLRSTVEFRNLALADQAAQPFALTIGTRYELGLSWVAENLPRLNHLAPERTLHLYFGDNDALFERLKRDRLDAVISSVRLTAPGLEYAPLHLETYEFVTSPSLFERQPLTSAEGAERHVLLDVHPDLPLFRYFVDAAPAEPAWRFGQVEHLGAISAIRTRLLQGVGVAVLPTYYVRDDLASGNLVRLIPSVRLQEDHFRLIWRSGHPRVDRLRGLADHLRRLPLR